jgi:Ca2+-binding EF-hand superfamily protein
MSTCLFENDLFEMSTKLRICVHDFPVAVEGKGSIRADQVYSALTTVFGLKVEKAEVLKMVQRYDKDSSGVIEFEEFAAMVDNFNKKRYHQAFSSFDIDHSGKLDAKEVKQVFESLGMALTDENVADMIKEYDDSGDGLIQFDEVRVHATVLQPPSTPLQHARAIVGRRHPHCDGKLPFTPLPAFAWCGPASLDCQTAGARPDAKPGRKARPP